jgi:hypothetical protein
VASNWGRLGKIFDYHHLKDAVNRALWKAVGGDGRPVFFGDIGAVCPGRLETADRATASAAVEPISRHSATAPSWRMI